MQSGGARDVVHDSLPYVDREYDDVHMRRYVDGLVEEEMRAEGPRDQQQDPRVPPAPPLSALHESPFLSALWERAAREEQTMVLTYPLACPPALLFVSRGAGYWASSSLSSWRCRLDILPASLSLFLCVLCSA